MNQIIVNIEKPRCSGCGLTIDYVTYSIEGYHEFCYVQRLLHRGPRND